MSAAVTTSAIVFTSAQLAHSFQTAVAERIIAYRNDDGTYSVTSSGGTAEYTVSWFDGAPLAAAMCSCPAGQHGRCCKHAAVAIFARKHGISAKRPAPTAADIEQQAYVDAARAELRQRGEYSGPIGFVTAATPGMSPALARLAAQNDAVNAAAAAIFGW